MLIYNTIYEDTTVRFEYLDDLTIAENIFTNCKIIIKEIYNSIQFSHNKYINCTFDFDFSKTGHVSIEEDYYLTECMGKYLDKVLPSKVPAEGGFTAYKVLQSRDMYDKVHYVYIPKRYIAELFIPAHAKRSSAGNDKCRASEAFVVSIVDLANGEYVDKVRHECFSVFGRDTDYIVGETVHANGWNPNRFEECTNGIHFFMNKEKALAFS